MRYPFTYLLILLLLLAASFSFYVMFNEKELDESLTISDTRSKSSATPTSKEIGKSTFPVARNKKISEQNSENSSTSNEVSLPFLIKYMGVDLNEDLGLFESAGELTEYYVGDELYQQKIFLIGLTEKRATLSYNNIEFEIEMLGANLLKPEPVVSYEEYMSMSKEEIGTRPKIVEHFVTLTQTPFIADGMLVSPGINPQLFEQAGLKEDDVLKSINGLSISIEEEFQKIQRLMPNADTLVIVVERRGRLITLYLDIPGEELEVRL